MTTIKRRKWLGWRLALCAAAAAILGLIGWRLFAPAPQRADNEHVSPRSATAKTRNPRADSLASGESAAQARMEGRVSSPTGPLAGAAVCATRAGAMMWGEAQVSCTRSDEMGEYAISAKRGAYTLIASRDAYVPQGYQGGEPFAFDATHDVVGIDFELAPGGAVLQGSVEDASGGPIAGAALTVFQIQPSLLSLQVRTDADGMFRVTVHEGAVSLAARAPGYAARTLEAVAPSAVEIALAPAGAIRGRVVAARDEEAVEGITVKAVQIGTNGVPIGPSGLSDEEGLFEIRDVAPGSYFLLGSGGSYQGRSLRPVKVPLGGRAEDALVVLNEGSHVRGRVSTVEDKPCMRGYVALGPPDPMQHPSAAREYAHEKVGRTQMSPIGPDGNVEFPGVPGGFYHVTVMCIGWFLESGPRVLRIGSEPIPELHWTVTKGAILDVRVVDGAGQPLPRAGFDLELPPDAESARGRVLPMLTDVDGRVSIPGLKFGTYTIRPMAGQAGEPVRVELEGQRSSAELRLAESGVILVDVISHDGKPVDGLRIDARTMADDTPAVSSATALGAGRYRIAPLARGRYEVSANDGVNPGDAQGGESRTQVTLAAGASTKITLKLPAQVSLTGRVISEWGEPAANVWISARAADPAGEASTFAPHRAGKRALSDLDGNFELTGLSASAHFDVRADDPEGSSVMVRGIAAGARVELRLPAAARVRGVVVDERGQPVRSYYLRAFTNDTFTEHTESVMNANGVFELEGISPGHVSLSAVTDKGRGEVPVALAAGQQVDGVRIVISGANAPGAPTH